MAIDPQSILRVLAAADHPLGIKELLVATKTNPGAATEMKRATRELVRAGDILRDGKRFRLPNVDQPVRAKQARGPSGERVPRAPRPVLVYREVTDPKQKKRKASNLVVGLVRKHRDGFGFVERYQGPGEDLFLPAVEAASTFDGDLVRVEVVPGTAGRTQARLVEVLERRRQLTIGTYVDRGIQDPFVVPSDPSVGNMVAVERTELAHDGDLVKVRLIEAGRAGHIPPRGEVLGRLGDRTDPAVEVLRAAYSQGFVDEFPAVTLHEADRVAIPIPESALEGRRDLRDMELVTIDGEDARDFDDAIFVERAGEGFRLVVAIADVAHYVEEGSPLDDEALRRTTSVYFPNAVLPMLPEVLSNGVCSLKPNQDRLCMVADMSLDAAGRPLKTDLYPAVMKSKARCTYTQVAKVLEKESVPELDFLGDRLRLAWELATHLNRQRQERGSIDFDIPEAKVVLDAQSRVIGMEKRPRNNAHRLVEECMLAANEAVARYFSERELPTLYRVHGAPNEEKLAAFAQLAEAHGIHLPPAMTPQALNALLAQVDGKPYQRAFNSLLLRAMMQASYTAENIGHYGLAAEHYLHFTSPIRRYPDLIVHRLLKLHWNRDSQARSAEDQLARLEAIALRCSERERGAMKAEREVDAFFGCLFLKDKVGKRFGGIVSAVTDFGLFVELEGLFVEGLLKTEDLGQRPEFDQLTQTLRIGTSGKTYSLGDRLEIEIRSVNLERRQTDLSLIEAGRVVGGRTGGAKTLDQAVAALRGARGGGAAPPKRGHQQRDDRRGGSKREEKHGSRGGKNSRRPRR